LGGSRWRQYPEVEMSSTDDYDDETSGPVSWSLKVKDGFWPSPVPRALTESGQPELIPTDQRREVMRGLDPQETKFSFGAFVLATIAGIAIPAYIIASNRVTKHGKDTIAVAPDAKLLGGVILLLCIIGFVSLWKRKKTLVAFTLFLLGFAFTLFIGLVGFVFILLGGWLMLRSWRINKYGTTNSKMIAKEAANRPRGKAARAAAPKSTGKTPSQPGARKPPTPSKRYTPKAPARKKIPKPTQ
jgi:hypothetical protein